MVKLSDLLVYKSLHGLGTERCLIFMTSSITNGIVTLTIVGVTSFLQLLDVQMYVKIGVSVQTRVAGNSDSLSKMAETL